MAPQPPPRIHAIPLAGPLTIFLLGGLVGLLAAYDAALSAPWLLWLAAGAALYAAIVALARTPQRLAAAAGLPVLAAAAGGLLLAAQYRHLGFDRKFGVIARAGELLSAPFPPLVATHIDANAAAGFLEGALPLAIGLALATRGRRRMIWAASALLIAAGVLLTASRGSWVALAAGALLGGLALVRRRMVVLERGRGGEGERGRGGAVVGGRWSVVGGRWSVVGVIVGLIGIAVLAVGQPALRRALDSAAYRAADRLTLYRNSLFLALDFPFSGIGPGATFGEVYSRFQLLILVPFVGYAHNLFLAVWLAQGLLGLLGFGALLLASFRLIWRGLRYGGSAIGWGSAIGCAVVLLHGLTDAPQYDTSWTTLLMAFALLGIAVGAARLADARPLVWIRLDRKRALGLAAAMLIALIAVGPWLLGAASANIASVLHARGLLAPLPDRERAALRDAAETWAEQALAYAPDMLPARKRRGMLALDAGEFGAAIELMEPALARTPADQSIRKALGYAYIWDGHVAEGVALLRELDRVDEVRQELDVWPVAWEQQGRADLAGRARDAAALWAK